MLKMPEFLKYPEWYIENENSKNMIGNNENRYTIKNNAPDFIKESYREYVREILKENSDEEIV